jgi:hypothetical protein
VRRPLSLRLSLSHAAAAHSLHISVGIDTLCDAAAAPCLCCWRCRRLEEESRKTAVVFAEVLRFTKDLEALSARQSVREAAIDKRLKDAEAAISDVGRRDEVWCGVLWCTVVYCDMMA